MTALTLIRTVQLRDLDAATAFTLINNTVQIDATHDDGYATLIGVLKTVTFSDGTVTLTLETITGPLVFTPAEIQEPADVTISFEDQGV